MENPLAKGSRAGRDEITPRYAEPSILYKELWSVEGLSTIFVTQ